MSQNEKSNDEQLIFSQLESRFINVSEDFFWNTFLENPNKSDLVLSPGQREYYNEYEKAYLEYENTERASLLVPDSLTIEQEIQVADKAMEKRIFECETKAETQQSQNENLLFTAFQNKDTDSLISLLKTDFEASPQALEKTHDFLNKNPHLITPEIEPFVILFNLDQTNQNNSYITPCTDAPIAQATVNSITL